MALCCRVHALRLAAGTTLTFYGLLIKNSRNLCPDLVQQSPDGTIVMSNCIKHNCAGSSQPQGMAGPSTGHQPAGSDPSGPPPSSEGKNAVTAVGAGVG
ncbi:hypothetical protein HaLaN_19085, partial [Haematococcus lacustris]